MSHKSRVPHIALAVAACIALHQPQARADAQPVVSAQSQHFSIRAQSLSTALRVFADQAREQVVFFSEIGKDQRSTEVVGNYTHEQALSRLLENTGLRFERLNDRTIAITSSSAPLSSQQAGDLQPIRLAQAGTARVAPSADAAGASPSDANDVEEVVVRGARFNDSEPGTALKVPLSIKDTPQTVLAITGDVMDFASVKSFQDVYKVDATGGTSHRVDNVNVNYFRGFRQDDNSNGVKVDGFRLTGTNLDFAPFERIEVVKGATSTMYGQNSVAGTLNAISKMPRDHFGGELKAEAGSFDHYRADLDFYGPITADGALTYRLVGARLDEGSYLKYAGKKTTVFAPTLRYEFSPDTSAFVRLNYQKTELTPHWGAGLQYLGDTLDGLANGFDPALLVIPDLPRSHFNGAAWNRSKFENTLLQASLEHRFANGWMLRASAQHNKQNMLFDDEEAGFIQADFQPLAASVNRNDNHYKVSGGEVNLYGDVELFGRRHTLFFGADYSSVRNPLLYTSADVVSPSLLDADFNTAVPPITNLEDYTFFFQRRFIQKNSGFTAQAFMRPIDGLTLLLGARYSHDDNGDSTRCCDASVLTGAVPFSVVKVKTDEVTLQTGATYAITPELNVYASYGETYSPQASLVSETEFASPEKGVAKEVGLKGAVLQRFSYSLALFDMRRSNIAQSRPDTPFVDLIGTQRSRGAEAEFQGTVIPGWELFAAVGVMDAEFTDGELKGYQPPEAPKLGVSMFTSYEVQEGAMRGVGIGAGVVHKQGRKTFLTPGDSEGRPIVFDFGDYTEVDMRLFYNAERWRVQLAATNIFNEKYYSGPPYGYWAYGVHVNPGRALIGQLLYRF